MMVNPIGQGETERVARGFLDCTLPKSEWTHHAHLRAGLWHLMRYSDAAALELLRERIRTYNQATGGTNTPSSGYHETITRFYLLMIRAFLRSTDATLSMDTLAETMIERMGERDLVLRYYSKEVLFSTEARAVWAEPDREKVPRAGIEPAT